MEFEIIVIDDGSPDGTQDVVRRLQDSYGDGRIVRVPPPRVSCARRCSSVRLLCCCRAGTCAGTTMTEHAAKGSLTGPWKAPCCGKAWMQTSAEQRPLRGASRAPHCNCC